MRVITIRHDKSKNNSLLEQSYQLYLEQRSNDPDIMDGADIRCKQVGTYLKENNILIHKFYSSCHLRALKTMSYIADAYDENIPREYFPEIHERGGIYLENKGYPGLNETQVKEMFPKVIIPDDVDITHGWYKKEFRETPEECKERAKLAIKKLKEMAMNCEQDNYTICLISHENFLNAFYSLLNGHEYLSENLSFGHNNLGMSSFTIDKQGKIKIDFINFSCLH